MLLWREKMQREDNMSSYPEVWWCSPPPCPCSSRWTWARRWRTRWPGRRAAASGMTCTPCRCREPSSGRIRRWILQRLQLQRDRGVGKPRALCPRFQFCRSPVPAGLMVEAGSCQTWDQLLFGTLWSSSPSPYNSSLPPPMAAWASTWRAHRPREALKAQPVKEAAAFFMPNTQNTHGVRILWVEAGDRLKWQIHA